MHCANEGPQKYRNTSVCMCGFERIFEFGMSTGEKIKCHVLELS